MMGLGEGGAGGGAGVVGAEGIGGSGVSSITSVPPGVLREVSSSRCSLRSLANLSRQASVCFEPFPRQGLQPGVSPNLMIVMHTALDFTSLGVGGGALPASGKGNLTEGIVRKCAPGSTLKSRPVY